MNVIEANLEALRNTINRFGKENLEEILFATAEGIRLISNRQRVRIYLEDLTGGVLSCAHVSGPYAEEIKETSFPIVSREALVSIVFASQSPTILTEAKNRSLPLDIRLANTYAIAATSLFPLVKHGRSIGVICIDDETPEKPPAEAVADLLIDFLNVIADNLDQARKYQQQILLTRRVEQFKKREAGAFMVNSAVRLIDRLSLASVLVPTIGSHGKTRMEVLASYSADPRLKALYDDLGSIRLGRGRSLVAKFVGDDGRINDEQLLQPVFIPDLTQQFLQKRALTDKMFLRSLYMVPRYEPETRKVICLVNYYSRENHQFSEFEAGILQTHAEMVERIIREIGDEHLEIRVLAEITDLLKERNEKLQTFLDKVLSKATKLIGADTGSIAVVREKDLEKWLVVEDDDGVIIGAKNKQWLKKKIPPFRIGGNELPKEARSLTGHVAWSRQPKIISNVEDEIRGEGFHYSTSEQIRSEIAMPITCEDTILGVICLNSLKQGYFTEEHKRILQIIESLTSRYIADIQQIENLQSQVSRLTSDVAYKDPLVSSYRLGNIIGNSHKAKELVDFINTVSVPLCNRIVSWSTNLPQEATLGLPSILVVGQTGAGKEFFFNNFYNKLNEMFRMKVKTGGELPVKKTNIAAYSGELTYSELFGHKKGAFTGAYSDRKGILEEAQGGIVFLDEIGDADPKTQVQLLRFLDSGSFFRLGESSERYGRVLLVAATNKNLQDEIKAGRFREDLYHRLSELTVRIPSLSERREDISDLATHFLGKLYRTYRGDDEPLNDAPLLSDGAKALLLTHRYEGNIRELRSILLRALFFRSGTSITENDIRRIIRDSEHEPPTNINDRLQEQLAEEVLAEIAAGKDFWEAVYEPYSKNRLPRDVVRLIIEKTRLAAGRTMPQIARALKAISGNSGDDPGDQKKYFKFKNFIYKTIRL
ncbi:MAG: GPMC system transcriptional regulator [Geobacteraceae bacterium]